MPLPSPTTLHFADLDLGGLADLARVNASGDPHVSVRVAAAAAELCLRLALPLVPYARTVGAAEELHGLEHCGDSDLDMEELWDGLLPAILEDTAASSVLVVTVRHFAIGDARHWLPAGAVGLVTVDALDYRGVHARADAQLESTPGGGRRTGDWKFADLTSAEFAWTAERPVAVLETLKRVAGKRI